MMKARLLLIINTFFTAILMVGCASNQPLSDKAAIATSHPLATQAGFRALDQGGNAFDAAVASAAVLSVVSPYGAGLGGGSVWLLQHKSGDSTWIDATETAPSQTASININSTPAFLDTPVSAGIPGQPAALAHISQHYGIRPLAANLADAIHIATRGFRVNKQYQQYAKQRLNALEKTPSSPFLVNGAIPEKGTIIKQPTLAKTLEQLARKGRHGFYQGDIAQRLVSEVNNGGGHWTLKDLNRYKIIERPAISFNYKDAVITTSPPPSYSGISILQTLKILERLDAQQNAPDKTEDLLSHILQNTDPRLALWLGDPDFSPNSTYTQFTSDAYISQQSKKIEHSLIKAAPQLVGGQPTTDYDNNEKFTPLISILDKWGNKVSVSLSMNSPFGSSFMSSSTGVLLNNSLARFSNHQQNERSRQSPFADSNAIEPNKRPLTYMSPTLVKSAGSTAIIGVSSGLQTPTHLVYAILNYMNGKPSNAWSQTPTFSQTPEVKHSSPKASSHTDMQVIRADKATGHIEASSGIMGGGQAIVR